MKLWIVVNYLFFFQFVNYIGTDVFDFGIMDVPINHAILYIQIQLVNYDQEL